MSVGHDASRTAGRVVLNPFQPGFTDDPYRHWQALRDRDPVHRSPLGYWVLSRYEDIARFTRHPALSIDARNAAAGMRDKITRRALGDTQLGKHAILNIDPPDHTRLRRLLGPAVTPRAIERLRPWMERFVDERLVRAGSEGGRMELVDDLAFPLAFAVISRILGMPHTEDEQLRRWTGVLVESLEVLTGPKMVQTMARAADEMTAYVREVLAWKSRNPADDLMSALLAAEHGGALSHEELIDQVILLYNAGHETSLNLIGNGTLALLRHRDQLERLQADPELDGNAVEELLRFDPPVQLSRRITREEVTVAGRTIPAGSLVVCILASANRDRARWGEGADTVDLSRDDAYAHLSFGGGVHHCLGAALARVEGRTAIGRLVRRFPRLELAGEPVWRRRITLRGLERLDLTLSPSPSPSL